jgi:hypothetical protein
MINAIDLSKLSNRRPWSSTWLRSLPILSTKINMIESKSTCQPWLTWSMSTTINVISVNLLPDKLQVNYDQRDQTVKLSTASWECAMSDCAQLRPLWGSSRSVHL